MTMTTFVLAYLTIYNRKQYNEFSRTVGLCSCDALEKLSEHDTVCPRAHKPAWQILSYTTFNEHDEMLKKH